MNQGLPCVQLDQWPPEIITRRLAEQALQLPDVSERQSRLADPSVRAITIPDEFARGSREAFIDDHEFCHLHPPPRGSVLLTLPPEIRQESIEFGWAEPHPFAGQGFLPAGLTLAYAPRNDRELRVVFGLIEVSYRFARGLL